MKDNEITIYHNDLNRVVLRRWTGEEKNIFFALITKMRDLDTKRVELDANEIKEIVQYNPKNKKRFEETLENAIRKIGQIIWEEKTAKDFTVMTLFTYLKFNYDNYTVEAEFSSNFSYIINRLTKNFMWFELKEFVKLRSSYSKTLYRLLKENKNLKHPHRNFSIDEFRLFMDIPKSYQISNIQSQVINQCMKELSPYFKNLRYKAVKANTRGTPVTGYIFKWDYEETRKTPEFVDKKYIEKAKNQRAKNKANHREPDEQTKGYIKKRREEYYQSIIDDRDDTIPENMSISDFIHKKGESEQTKGARLAQSQLD